MLYVIENEPQMVNIRQYGNDQYSVSVEYGLTSRFINPDLILGELVVGSTPYGTGRIYLYRYGVSMYGGDSMYGSNDPMALNPQPYVYERTDDPQYWGYYLHCLHFLIVLQQVSQNF
jgi:hypothetical protein